MYRDSAQRTRFERMMSASWPLFRAFGAEVRVHWLVVLVPFVFYVMLTKSRFEPQTAGLWAGGLTVALYASVWMHEMAHIAIGRRFGIPSRLVTLSPLGGLAHFESPMPSPRAEVWTAFAGPVAQMALAIALGVPYLVLGIGAREAPWAGIYQWFLVWQVSLVVFNLLPCYPMDGGRVLRGLLARRMHSSKASLWTAQIGYAGGIVLSLVGLGILFARSEVIYAQYGGMLLVWVGVGNFFACRRLQMEAKHAESPYEPVEAWKRGHASEPWRESLAESERLSRDEERRERREAEARRREEEHRRRLQERIDELLDRINELGGVEKLSPSERRELAEASELLRRETAER